MAQADKSPHRMKHIESVDNNATTLKFLKQGDVFVREGTPCMRISMDQVADGQDGCWIVNLTNGKAWRTNVADHVHPAADVVLDFKTSRR